METTNSIIDNSIYAGFWKRFAAHLIDSLIILIPILTILTIIRNNGGSFDENDLNVFAVIIGWLYYAISESSSSQATFGKRIMKIKVTGINGTRIKLGKATGRFFGKFISAIFLFMGFIMVAFTEKRQGLHDILSKCLVTNNEKGSSKKELSPGTDALPAQMLKYRNNKSNLTVIYPQNWEIIWENEPDGGWEIIVGIAGKQSQAGRPVVTIRKLPHPVINFESANVSVFAAGGSVQPSELVRTAQDYNEECKQELIKVFPGIRFILDTIGSHAGIPSATLVYTYTGTGGTIQEKQINIFGKTVTYRLMAELPEDQIESAGKYFDVIVANFNPVSE